MDIKFGLGHIAPGLLRVDHRINGGYGGGNCWEQQIIGETVTFFG